VSAVGLPPAAEPKAIQEKWAICNPLEHHDWDSLLTGHAGASVFHTAGWAQVLHDTYGHIPFYFSRFADGELMDLLPVMEVRSRLTGRRGVSLPFTDFCDPLAVDRAATSRLHQMGLEAGRERGWKYLECRDDTPWSEEPAGPPSVSFYGHVISLDSSEETLLKRLDGGVRRGIRKAQASGLRVEFDASIDAVRTFYKLHCQTRKRHGLPPQPLRFFENIARCLLQCGKGFIATTLLEAKPIAALLFLHHGSEAIYKFGASDYSFQNLRPNNLAMWEGIRQCAALGCVRLHLGRTSLTNEGLRRFKLGFGACEETIGCRKFNLAKNTFVPEIDRAETWMNNIWRHLPVPALRLAGHAIYPHLS
jgi:hypothetical protein